MKHPRNATSGVLRPLHVRSANRAVVLELLRHNDHMSRADLARLCGLSEAAVSRIIGRLMDEGLVREDGAENSTGGRPGRRLELDPSRVSIGADIQNWETRVAVSTMRGRILESRSFRTPSSPGETLDAIAHAFRHYGSVLGNQRVRGVGVSARGIVNSDTGVVVVGNHADWINVPIRQTLEAKLGEPVYLENNVRAAALAEYNYGAPEVFGSQSFLFVKVDEGVGMGILLGGKLYAGPRMAAGEFGQMVIAMQSTPAIGKAAYSLENLISNPAICERYAGHEVANINDTRSRVAKIAALASQGEGPAREALEETGRYLATGIANVVWGLDADVVVIDGAITDAWALLDPILRRHVTDSYRGAGLHVLIRPSALGGDAALIGAATLPLMTVFATEAPTRAIGAGV